MKKFLIYILILLSNTLYGQCVGNQTFTLNPPLPAGGYLQESKRIKDSVILAKKRIRELNQKADLEKDILKKNTKNTLTTFTKLIVYSVEDRKIL